MSEREELRVKIKKLKYKIEKQEKLNQILKKDTQYLNRLNDDQLSIEGVLRKVHFLLDLKGMTLADWLYSLPYSKTCYMDDLIDVLEKIGIKLLVDEKALLINFCSQNMCEVTSFREISGLATKSGIRMS